MSARRSRRARTPKRTSRSPRLLRCEQLESRTVLAAISPLGNLHLLALSPGGNSASIRRDGRAARGRPWPKRPAPA